MKDDYKIDFSIHKKLTILISVIIGTAFLIIYFLSLYNIDSIFRNKAEERHNIFIRSFRQGFFGITENISILSDIIVKNDELYNAVIKDDIYAVYGKLADLIRNLGLNQYSVKAQIFRNNDLIASIPGEFEIGFPLNIRDNINKGLKGRFFEIIDGKLYFISLNTMFDKDGTNLCSLILIIRIDNDFLERFREASADMFFVLEGKKVLYNQESELEVFYGTHRYSSLILDKERDIRIIAGDDLTELRVTLRQYTLWVSGFLGIIFLAGLYISSRLSQKITNPVNELVKISRDIAEGNLDIEIKNRSDDEIGLLSDTMENMRLRLKDTISELRITNKDLDRRILELTIINELTNEMNYLQDYHEVFRVILRKLCEALSLEICSVMVVHDETALEIIEANVRGRFISVDNKRFSNLKAAGKALNLGKAVIVGDADNTVLFEKGENHYVKNIMCYPFRVKNEMRGVFNLTNRKGRWNSKSVEIAGLIINQGIISIDNARLYEMAITDGLTGLYIHRFFQVRLSEEITKAEKNGTSLALVMFDIDHFKKFNDNYGHQTGDRVLAMVSDIIRKNVRKGIDIAARYGGEEFAVIIPEADHEIAYIFAERLRKRIMEKELYYDDQKLNVTISLGIASYPKHSAGKMDLICKADNALYASKENGRNMTTVFSNQK